METKEEEWFRFIDTLAHELKTPLTSIIAASGLLAEELESITDKSTQKLIQTIIQNSSTLEKRLSELLDTVRTGSGKIQLQLEPVDMKSIIQGTCVQMAPLVQGKNHTLTTNVPAALPLIHGDGPRLGAGHAQSYDQCREVHPSRRAHLYYRPRGRPRPDGFRQR